MNAKEALRFIEQHGIVLQSGKGPAPRLVEAIAGEPIRGSWWAHPKSKAIFRVLCAVADSDEILICRLVDGKVTFVHKRVWPALARVAKRLPPERIAQVKQEHTPSGRHVTRTIPVSEWLPPASLKESRKLSEDQAIEILGSAIVAKATRRDP